jgi:hypothetical protein
MTNPELNRQFYAALDGMQLSAEGLKEYEDVSADARTLQDALIEHMMELSGFDPHNPTDADQAHLYLENLLQHDFANIHSLNYGDEIIADGSTLVYARYQKGYGSLEQLSSTIRLHGTICGLGVVSVPSISSQELAEIDAVTILDRELPMQISAAIEIDNPVFEDLDAIDSDSHFETVRPEHRLFVALAYSGLRINRLTTSNRDTPHIP